MNIFSVYLIQCETIKGFKTYYTGMTGNWERREKDHFSGNGAKFTKQYIPVLGIQIQENLSKKDALKLEKIIKRLGNKEKEDLFYENFYKCL